MRNTEELKTDIKIDMPKPQELKVSDYLCFIPVEESVNENGEKDLISIGWNRFYPSVFILNNQARHILDMIRIGQFPETSTPDETKELNQFLEALKQYRFVYEGDSDPSRNDFIQMVEKALEEPARMAEEFYREKLDYKDLKIVSDECNLSCSYCINRYQNEPTCQFLAGNAKMKELDKLKLINRCIDQFMARKVSQGAEKVEIFFNGGEILLEWHTIKHIVQRLARKFKKIKAVYEMNTNLTLLTEEMARFFHEHEFKLHISIDGYRDSHNRTRKFRNGTGSFDTVIEKVKMFREIGENKPHILSAYQGTLDFLDNFHPGEVYQMDQYGFNRARLAPNLLNTSEEDAIKKAHLMGQFLELNDRRTFQVMELIFNRCKDKINMEQYRFQFNCQGLSALPKLSLQINISTLGISHLCGFIPSATVHLPDLDYDIYHPKLWNTSYKFIAQRMQTVLDQCMECPLVAICVGGCILSGIDNQNQVNPAACAYQKEMWKIYIKKAYQDNKKSDINNKEMEQNIT